MNGHLYTNLMWPGQCRTNIRIYLDIRILFSEYPIFEYEYWVFTKQIYSSIRFVNFKYPNIFGYSICKLSINEFIRFISF
jgi:hypothetical protein